MVLGEEEREQVGNKIASLVLLVFVRIPGVYIPWKETNMQMTPSCTFGPLGHVFPKCHNHINTNSLSK